MTTCQPETLTERVNRCTTIRYAMMLTSALGNVQSEREDMGYTEALWWSNAAAETLAGENGTIHKRLKERVDPVTLQMAARGRV